ncbi:MAG TPA: hypothetical protein VFT71_02125 [Candidatus Nitrosocosmicus sp.]|nr:hypothetical protein [Candidatus Nitrosocosmicus sp.]
MAIIAVLIYTVFFKLNKINLGSLSSSTTKNTELDKKVEQKLMGMQIKLNEILTEISSATKEQKESISNMATAVKASVDAVASVAAASTSTANTSATTSAATTAIPYARRVSTFTLTEPFASPIFTTPNITASETASSISINNPTRFMSGLFDRSDDGYTRKSEFLDIDLDSDSSDPSNGDSYSLGSKLQNQDDLVDTQVIHGTTDAQSDISDPTALSGSNVCRFSTNSRHHYYPVAHDYLNYQRQDTDFAPSESSSSQFHDGDGTIRRIKENDIKGGRGEDQVEEKEEKEKDLSHDQNNNEIKEIEIEKLPLSSEKNSNPELDKIDEEILTALQRLGGNYESEDKDKPQH